MQGRHKQNQRVSREFHKQRDISSSRSSDAFGVDDDLSLSSQAAHVGNDVYYTEVAEHVSEQLRQLRDENGRLFRLVREKEYELKQEQKKHEDERRVLGGGGDLAGDTAAAKIVELAKKVRDLNMQLEQERTKVRQLMKKIKDSEINGMKRASVSSNEQASSETGDAEVKALQDKLQHAQSKMAEFRNQCEFLKKDLKVAHKVLSNEVGEGVNIQLLLNKDSTWRGRAQQICLLQEKVTELKAQLKEAKQKVQSVTEGQKELSPSSCELQQQKFLQDRNKEQLRMAERTQREMQQKVTEDLKKLEDDYAELQSKNEALKARNKVLMSEVKQAKSQVSVLLEKGGHDDELIQALMKQQAQLKQMIDNGASIQRKIQREHNSDINDLKLQHQRDNGTIDQLREKLTEKEERVKQLEKDIKALKAEQSRMLKEAEDEKVSRLSVPLSQSASLDDSLCSRHSPAYGDIDALREKIMEYEVLTNAADVERQKLILLTETQQKSIDECNKKLLDTDMLLQQEMKRTTKLEKQLGNLMANKQNKYSKKTAANKALEALAVEEWQTRFELLRQENDALREALDSTIRSKQEDLQYYQHMIEKNKQIFLQGLKQYKQQCKPAS